MLILTRRVNENIVLSVPGASPVEIHIGVREIDRGKVRLAIDAPLAVKVWREEIAPGPARAS